MTNAETHIRSFGLLSQINRKKRSDPLKTKNTKTTTKTGKVHEQAFCSSLMAIQHLMRSSTSLIVGDANKKEVFFSQQIGKIKEC